MPIKYGNYVNGRIWGNPTTKCLKIFILSLVKNTSIVSIK